MTSFIHNTEVECRRRAMRLMQWIHDGVLQPHIPVIKKNIDIIVKNYEKHVISTTVENPFSEEDIRLQITIQNALARQFIMGYRLA